MKADFRICQTKTICFIVLMPSFERSKNKYKILFLEAVLLWVFASIFPIIMHFQIDPYPEEWRIRNPVWKSSWSTHTHTGNREIVFHQWASSILITWCYQPIGNQEFKFRITMWTSAQEWRGIGWDLRRISIFEFKCGR